MFSEILIKIKNIYFKIFENISNSKKNNILNNKFIKDLYHEYLI